MKTFSYSYYFALVAGYTVSLLGWWLVDRWKPNIWKSNPDFQFQHPWRETLWALAAAVATVAMGQLYSGGMLLPKSFIAGTAITAALNQIIIFLPFILLLALRRQPLTTAWLPSNAVIARLGTGMVLALCAVSGFVLIRDPLQSLPEVLQNVYDPKNLGYSVQVFLQDVAIAVLFVRFRSAVGKKWFLIATVSIAFLFSVSHYPLKLNQGLSFLLATRDVIIDGILVSGIIYVLQRSKDILWFWWIHFAMDMMQFCTGDPTL